MGYVERVLQPGETIAYRARLHWIIYLWGILLVLAAVGLAIASAVLKAETTRIALLALAALALVVGLAQMFRAWLAAANTEFIVTSRRVIYKRGLFSRSTVEMSLDKVASVLVRQTLMGRMLDYGAVTVRGVGSELEPVERLAAPLALHHHLGAPAATA